MKINKLMLTKLRASSLILKPLIICRKSLNKRAWPIDNEDRRLNDESLKKDNGTRRHKHIYFFLKRR